MPYSGPASAYGVIGKTETAYFKMVNEMGGIENMRINTSLTNFSPIRQTQLANFDGQSWQLFGELLMG
jgi:hypothetical protein